MNKFKKAIKNPGLAMSHLFTKLPVGRLSDETYLKIKYYLQMGTGLDLKFPQTFNEKLQWLKLYNRKPEYSIMADKYKARDYVREKLGEEYLIPLLGVWDRPDEIDFNALPDQFVLKCNHNSGLGMCICKDKFALDIEKVRRELFRGLRQDYYLFGREWPYKDVPRKIIAEQYMTDAPGEESFTDYKFFCFNGKADSVMICLDRNINDTKFFFFNKGWSLCRYNVRGRAAPEGFTLPKPEHMDEMFRIAEHLSENIPFVRVDLYHAHGRIYFGEMTFFPDSGFDRNLLPETDAYFGRLLDVEVLDEKHRAAD